jgi:hypothetical protein
MTTPLQLAHARATELFAQAAALEAQANELRRQGHHAIAEAENAGPRVVTLSQRLARH